MTEDEDKLHEEAEELRKETAADAPELAEHDRLAELEQQLEEARTDSGETFDEESRGLFGRRRR